MKGKEMVGEIREMRQQSKDKGKTDKNGCFAVAKRKL